MVKVALAIPLESAHVLPYTSHLSFWKNLYTSYRTRPTCHSGRICTRLIGYKQDVYRFFQNDKWDVYGKTCTDSCGITKTTLTTQRKYHHFITDSNESLISVSASSYQRLNLANYSITNTFFSTFAL